MIDPTSTESEVEAVVALFAMLVINIGAATLIEYEKGARYGYMALYTLVGVIILWPMFLIVTRVKKTGATEDSAMFIYNKTTMHVGKWLLAWASIFLFCFVAMGSSGRWIGQERPDPAVVNTAFTKFDNGIPCFRIKAIVRARNFGGRVPENVKLAITANDAILKDWKLSDASWINLTEAITIVGEDGKPQPVMAAATVRRIDDPQPPTIDVEFNGLHQSDGTYQFNFDFKPLDIEVARMQEEVANADDEQLAALAAKWQSEYEERYKNARQESLKKGGINLKWQEPSLVPGD